MLVRILIFVRKYWDVILDTNRSVFAQEKFFSINLSNDLGRMGNWLGTSLNQFQMSQEHLTKPGFEPETSYQLSY